MRIWWLFLECLLHDRSFVFIFPHYFSFHFFISYAFHQVGMWGSEELGLQTGVTKLLGTKCELSQGLPDSEASEKIPVASSHLCSHVSDWVHLMVKVCFENWQFHHSLDLWEEVYKHPTGKEQYASWVPASCKYPSDVFGDSLTVLTPSLIKHLFVFLSHQIRCHGLELW